jgi:hypothetical protein
LATLIALVADHGRINSHCVTDPHSCHRAAGLLDGGGAFVAQDKRELDRAGTDSAGLKVMDIGAADADLLDSQQDIGILAEGGRGDLNKLELS